MSPKICHQYNPSSVTYVDEALLTAINMILAWSKIFFRWFNGCNCEFPSRVVRREEQTCSHFLWFFVQLTRRSNMVWFEIRRKGFEYLIGLHNSITQPGPKLYIVGLVFTYYFLQSQTNYINLNLCNGCPRVFVLSLNFILDKFWSLFIKNIDFRFK